MDAHEIKELLTYYNLAPLKSRGQHFLINERALNEILHVANITQYDTILEIGPGLGVLTKELAALAKQVIAVEIDKGFAKVLKRRFHDKPNVAIVHGDILEVDPKNYSLQTTSYKLVGNLPYNLTSLILEKFLRQEPKKPAQLIITIQKEFALRVTAHPPNMNRMGLLCQYYGTPRIVARFPPSYFWPKPKVHSSLVLIDVTPPKALPLKANDEERLWASIKTAFSQPRKMLKNSLSLISGGFGKKRPQELTLENWITLVRST